MTWPRSRRYQIVGMVIGMLIFVITFPISDHYLVGAIVTYPIEIITEIVVRITSCHSWSCLPFVYLFGLFIYATLGWDVGVMMPKIQIEPVEVVL